MEFGLNQGMLLREAKMLIASKFLKATPQLIREYYGEGAWWYTVKNRKDAPSPYYIRQTWGQWATSESHKPKREIASADEIRKAMGK
jgi:hypothetical protein